MKKCHAPDGSLLPATHRDFLAGLLRTLDASGYRQRKIQPLLPELLAEFNELCATDEDMAAWCDELSRWVRWYRAASHGVV